MSRLLPEPFSVGLIGKCCWLRSRHGVEPLDLPAGIDAVEAFGPAVRRIADIGGQGSKVSVLLSDAAARVTLLPWQPQLLSGDQLRAYVRACFERAGTKIGMEWTIHAGYRNFGTPGMATAVPTHLLDRLSLEAKDCGVRLVGAMPVAATAYWQHRRAWRRDLKTLFLFEPDRLTLLRSDAGRFDMIDAQPVGDDTSLALRRLVQRHAGRAPATIDWWTPPGLDLDMACLEQHYPGVPVRHLDPAVWGIG